MKRSNDKVKTAEGGISADLLDKKSRRKKPGKDPEMAREKKRAKKAGRKRGKKQKKPKRKPELKSYVAFCFMAVVVFILVIIWIFQYFFLPKYYRAAKIRDVIAAGDKVIAALDSGSDKLEQKTRNLAFEHNMFILVTDDEGNTVVNVNNMGDFSFFDEDRKNNFGKTLYQFRQKLPDSKNGYITKILKLEELGHEEIFYCTSFNTGGREMYIYLEAPIEAIDSTVSIIREQLMYISVILFELAFIATVLISRRLSRPIEDLTETATKFGEGDYDVEFKADGYREIEELAMVLDEARDEVRKVTDLRKELIANVSHDLRTPLTMVKAYAEMIRDLSGDIPEKREKHCAIIIDEADRLSNLVNSLLELSRLENTDNELSVSDYDINTQLEEVMTRYTLMIEQNGYDIKYIPDEQAIITADRDKLAQVIYNFINNAINYSGEHKVIRIRQVNKQDVVRVEISDNGMGIPQDKLAEVFDRYYRGGKVKRETVGTGLGLSICKEILKKHDFAFGVISEEGKGSTFWFEANRAAEK